MVVGDDHIYALRLGVGDSLMGGDACVTRQHQVNPVRDKLLQHREIDAVGLALAVGDVVSDRRANLLQRGDQECRRRLAVYVEVAPDADYLSLPDGPLQSLGRFHQVRELRRRGGPVTIGIEEGPGCIHVGEPSSGQGLRHQRMPAGGGLQFLGDLDV